MEWDTDPLLREEIAAPKRGKASQYAWSDVAGVSVLSYLGHPIGRVHVDGQYVLRWRGRVHEGKAGSAKQAKRFMGGGSRRGVSSRPCLQRTPRLQRWSRWPASFGITTTGSSDGRDQHAATDLTCL